MDKLPGKKEVTESGPLGAVLNGIKVHLYSQLINFKFNGIRGILGRYLFNLQPETFDIKFPLDKI